MIKILVIEDNLAIRENTVEILELQGYQVASAIDGVAGLALALVELPHLILCDIHMPGLNGEEVLRQLKTNSNAADIPFVFVSSSAEKKEIESAMQLGAQGYLCKPFTTEALMDEINRILLVV